MRIHTLLACAALLLPSAATAATVSLSGTVLNSCVLTLSTSGTLLPSADGTSLSSTESGALKAVVAVVATGTNPTVSFSAPVLTGPSASVAGATKTMSYSSPGGASQVATSGASSYVVNRLIDTVTVDASATNSNGFTNGSYAISATATCQQ